MILTANANMTSDDQMDDEKSSGHQDEEVRLDPGIATRCPEAVLDRKRSGGHRLYPAMSRFCRDHPTDDAQSELHWRLYEVVRLFRSKVRYFEDSLQVSSA